MEDDVRVAPVESMFGEALFASATVSGLLMLLVGTGSVDIDDVSRTLRDTLQLIEDHRDASQDDAAIWDYAGVRMQQLMKRIGSMPQTGLKALNG